MKSDDFNQWTESVRDHLFAAAQMKQSLLETHAALVARLAVTMARAFFKGNKVILCGNGGSASDAQHIAAEFVGRFRRERMALPSLALTANAAAMTAIANDYGYENVFDRQVRALAKPGDVFIGLTTSGQSPNVVAAAKTAKSLGLSTVSFTGGKPSPLSEICDIHVSVPSTVTARVQEAHVLLCHIACEVVDDLLFGETQPPAGLGHLHLPKLTTVEDLLTVRNRWRRLGLKVVWTNGCFDLIHVGHVRNLTAAKQLGDILVVGVNSDESVRSIKGEMRPIVPDEDRAELISALACVDHVVIFNDSDPTNVIALLKPDVHTKGTEYSSGARHMPERDVVLSYGGSIEYLPLASGHSTTNMIERILSLTSRVG
jgi:phosphoheptose isomerase